MASTSKKVYPSRLFEDGKTPLRHRSMNHNCHLVNVTRIRTELGEDVWLDLKMSSLGVVTKFTEIPFIFWASIVHYFITRQLVTDLEHELWTVVQGKPIRFSLNEFADLTHLNCDPFGETVEADMSHKDFWTEMGVEEGHGPCLENLLEVFPRCRFWSFEKRRMVARLCILSIVILGVSKSTRIPLEYAKLVLDPDRFDKFPWGRVAFSSLLDGVKVIDYTQRKSYCIRGFVQVLHIWALESIPVIGEVYGNRREGVDVPLLSWNGSRKHIDWRKIFEMDKKTHGQV